MEKPTCSMPQCDRQATSRGLCSSCYGKEYRAGRLTKQMRAGHHSLSDVDLDEATAVCAICGPTRIRVRTGRRGHECITQAAKRGGTPSRHRRSRYKLDPDAYQSLLDGQGEVCAICYQREKLYVDHDHKTGAVRGLLCNRCNITLGFALDEPARLMSAAAYLLGR